MTEIRVRRDAESSLDVVDDSNPFPVAIVENGARVGRPELFATEWVRVPYGATSGALDANDAYGDEVRAGAPVRCRLLSIQVVDQADVVVAGTLSIYLSTRQFTAAASDAAFTISAADALYAGGPPVAL